LRRPLEIFLQEGSDPEQLVSHTVFGESVANPEAANLRGRVFQQFDQAGVVTSESYDFKGNLLVGQRQLAQDYKTTLDWSAKPVFDDKVYTSRTSYDALNRPVSLTAPDGSITRPQFNATGLLQKLDVQQRGASKPTAFVTGIDYDAKSQRTSIVYGNGLRTTYSYDPLTFRLRQCRTLRGGERLQDLGYAYDPAGNITSIDDKAQQTLYFNNAVISPTNKYIYDAIYRLIATEGREHIGQVSQPETTWNDIGRVNLPHPNDGQAMRRYSELYIYDAVGNLLKVAHNATNGRWNRNFTYQEASLIEPDKQSNRLSRVVVGAAAPEIYPYDAHGNMMAMPHLASMNWDFRDQLRRVDLGGGGAAYYVYDASGQRLRKVVEKNGGALIEERITLGGFEIFRRRNTAGITLERETLHVMDDRKRIAIVDTRTQGAEADVPAQLIRYQLCNHLRSATLEVDSAAQIISYEEYYSYGSTSYQAGRTAAEVSLKRYRYTGMERDEETGLNYHAARYYAPWLARWASCDPLGPVDHANLYVFCRNNPINLVDQNGCNSDKVERVESDLRQARGALDKFQAQQVDLLGQKAIQEVNIELRQSNVDAAKQAISDAEVKQLLKGDRAGFERGAGMRGLKKNLELAESKLSKAQAALKKTVARLKHVEKQITSTERTIGKLVKRAQKLGANINAAPSDPKVTAEDFADTGSDPLEEKFRKLEGKQSPSPKIKGTTNSGSVSRATSTAKKVIGGAGIAAAAGTVVKKLPEGRPGEAATAAGEAAGSAYVLARVPALVPLAVMASTIGAYNNEVQVHANSAGSWIEDKTGNRIIGGVAASAAATGESLFQGTFGVVGREIGEGAAAGYIRLTSDEYTLIPWKSQIWADIFD
jgi:RHS repeat-associated protein